MKEGYFKSKLREIEGEIAIAVGAANLIGIMYGECNDTVIKARDDATRKVHKIVGQLLKRQLKEL